MTDKKQSIILGGLVAGLLSTSYLGLINIACCAGIVGGALVGVWHYTNENSLTIKPGEGAAMGAIIGLLAVAISAALNYLLQFVGIPGSEEIQKQIQHMFTGGDMTPEQKEAIEAQQQQFNTPAFKAIGIAVGAAVSVIFGAIGGAIGAAVFKKGGDAAAEVF